jgi:undecaprenyl-diphosphatase
MSLDDALLGAINGLAGQSGLIDGLVVIFSDLGLVILPALLLATGRRRPAIAGLAAFVVSGTLGEILNVLSARPRPIPLHPVVPYGWLYDSFPSGHTTAAFAFAAVLARERPRHAVAAFVFAALVGLSRIYIGVHYPSDVLAGAILGTAVGLGTCALIGRWRPSG